MGQIEDPADDVFVDPLEVQVLLGDLRAVRLYAVIDDVVEPGDVRHALEPGDVLLRSASALPNARGVQLREKANEVLRGLPRAPVPGPLAGCQASMPWRFVHCS